MSTAFYPTNMRRQSASGYSNKSTLENIPYVSWKGDGKYSNPIGLTANHIRPLTNNDPGNVFPTGFGLARPLKQYRKGTVIPTHHINASVLVDYNTNRAVKSSVASSLGGGNGGTGLIAQMMEMPGSVSIKDNDTNTDCKNCKGASIISDWMPIRNLTEKPQPNVTNPILCCNQQRKAIRRTLPNNTNVKQNYYQTNHMYLYNRCQTFQQRQFNFLSGPTDKAIEALFKTYPFVTAKILEYSKPGDPLSIINYYVAQCNPNVIIDKSIESGYLNALANELLKAGYITDDEYHKLETIDSVSSFLTSLQNILTTEQYKKVIEYLYNVASISPTKGCSRVYYKPNNPQFAQQGGVSSSTRILKLTVDTINTSAYRQKTNPANSATAIQYGFEPATPFIYKDKVPACQKQTYIGNPFFFQGQVQNKHLCASY
jgi:hypothetical protein